MPNTPEHRRRSENHTPNLEGLAENRKPNFLFGGRLGTTEQLETRKMRCGTIGYQASRELRGNIVRLGLWETSRPNLAMKHLKTSGSANMVLNISMGLAITQVRQIAVWAPVNRSPPRRFPRPNVLLLWPGHVFAFGVVQQVQLATSASSFFALARPGKVGRVVTAGLPSPSDPLRSV